MKQQFDRLFPLLEPTGFNKIHKITVTKADLKYPHSDVFNCPIAQAVMRTFKTKDVIVLASRFIVNGEITYKIPYKADKKAERRSCTLLGKILGGFSFYTHEL